MKTIIKAVQNRLLQHSLFWAFSLYLFLRMVALEEEIYKIDVIYGVLFHISLLAAVYLNLYYLIPQFLSSRKYLLYLCLLGALIVCTSWLNIWFVDGLGGLIFEGYYFISELTFFQISQYTTVYVLLTSLLKWSKSWFKVAEQERRIRRLEKEKLKAELEALKSQINPHFLFNSLNNIYALALDEDKKTPAVILGLSKCLRYMLYECGEEKVLLKKEINYIKDYIDLQKLRLEHPASINFEIQGKIENQKIAPLLFTPIIENGFKHGVKGDTENAYLNILLKVEDQQLILHTENNKGQATEVENSKHKGLGLSNLKQQLDLLYPNKHQLNIQENEQLFSLDLKIDLS
jgi:sensor histidine kinase YesM